MARPTYLPSRVHEGSPFFTSSPAFLLFFDDGHSDRCEVILHGVFGLHFLMITDVRASFHVSVGHLYVFFANMYMQVLCPFF